MSSAAAAVGGAQWSPLNGPAPEAVRVGNKAVKMSAEVCVRQYCSRGDSWRHGDDDEVDEVFGVHICNSD